MSEDLPSPIPLDGQDVSPTASEPLRIESVRFCGICGTVIEADWSDCQICSARSARRAAALTSGDLSIAEERRSITKAVSLYMSLLAISIVGLAIASTRSGPIQLFALSFEEVVFVGVTLIWSILSYRMLVPILLKTGPARWLLAAPCLGLLTFVVATLAVSGMDRLLQMPEIKYLNVFHRAGYGLGLATIYIAVEPAIFEELAFRGVIFDSLKRVTGSTEAIFASAAMFAILHLSIPSFMHLFLMGIVLGWLRSKTGSLYAGMMLHFMHNFLCLLQEHLGGFNLW